MKEMKEEEKTGDDPACSAKPALQDVASSGALSPALPFTQLMAL